MKTRFGFVSNSSTSSFLIYGVCIDSSVINTLNKHPKYQAAKIDPVLSEDYEDEDYELSDGELLEDAISTLNLDLRVYCPYNEDCYVGLSPTRIKDDETGRQFKDRVEADIKTLFPDQNLKFSFESEAYYS